MKKRGIYCDVGHGGGSFAWTVAAPIIRGGYLPDSISTDLHVGSMNNGMKDLLNVADKLMLLGETIPEVVAEMTSHPAHEIGQEQLGNLSVRESVPENPTCVASRGGGLPLLLSSIFHIGNASNSISWDTYQHFARHPAVAWTIPISMGDPTTDTASSPQTITSTRTINTAGTNHSASRRATHPRESSTLFLAPRWANASMTTWGSRSFSLTASRISRYSTT